LSKLDQELRGQLRKLGVRFGFYHVFMPALLKPAPARLLALLSLIEANQQSETPRDIAASLEDLPSAGLTSCARAPLPFWLYRAAGFYTTKTRAIRLDMLERLADLIRPALEESKAAHGRGFQASEAMMSIMGCGAEELAEILTALGYQSHQAEAPQAETPQAETPVADAPQAEAVADATGEEPVEEAGAEEAGQEIVQEAVSPEAEADDAATNQVTYWRPARNAAKGGKRNAGPKGQNRPGGAKGQNGGARAATKSGGPRHKQTSKQAGKQAAKQADPNSPFAVLKNLQSGGNE